MTEPRISPQRIPVNKARRDIIAAANRRRDNWLPPYMLRHINEAVQCVRHHRLVSDGTLIAAGFRVRR